MAVGDACVEERAKAAAAEFYFVFDEEGDLPVVDRGVDVETSAQLVALHAQGVATVKGIGFE